MIRWASRFWGLGRFYRSLPPHHDAASLIKNMDRLSWFLRDAAPGEGSGWRRRPWRNSWQYQLGNDIDKLARYAEASDPDADFAHYFDEGSGK